MTDATEDQEEIANEITAAARQARETAERVESRKWPLAKIGIGIGSAALAAAVLYAARSRRKN